MKIEFDLPNFEKEISINITIKKDGEVVYNQTTSPSLNNHLNSSVINDSITVTSNTATTIGEGRITEQTHRLSNNYNVSSLDPMQAPEEKKPSSGNFMDPNLF